MCKEKRVFTENELQKGFVIETCSVCNGSGEIENDVCGRCNGDGIIEVDLQHCMECGEVYLKHELYWLNDAYGIPFKKVCGNCTQKVEAHLENLGRYESSCPIDEEY